MGNPDEALWFLHGMHARSAAEEWENAKPIVISRDPETNHTTVTGPFDSVPDAMQYANDLRADFDQDSDLSNVIIEVRPMHPPEIDN